MPYCCQCGTQVGAADNFCAKCGGRQPVIHLPGSIATEAPSGSGGSAGAPSATSSTSTGPTSSGPTGSSFRADGGPNPYHSSTRYGSGSSGFSTNATGGISPKTASLLCYIPWFGWIAAVIVLATERFKRDTIEGPEVRFHAFQGLYLFVAWLVVDWVIAPMLSFGMGFGHGFPHPLGGLLKMLILAAWIVMIVKVSQNEHYRLPIIGEMAERSVHEQRV
jgi:uncharacterized membrane protein